MFLGAVSPKDIAYLKTLFVKENLLLRFENSGTYFQGSESQIQRMLKRFILLTVEHGENLLFMTNVSLFEKKINALFAIDHRKANGDPQESYIQSIVVSILLIVERSNRQISWI